MRQGVFRQLEREPGMTVAVCPVRPDSRGTIMAVSPDPFEYPAIRPNYLSAPSDLRVLIAGIGHTRRIFAQPAIARYSVAETVPGPEVTTDEQFAEFARQAGTNVFHPVGTCKMGTDPMAVVDPRLRVHGIARAAGHRRLDHAGGDHRQHQRADDHDRREGRRDDQGRCPRRRCCLTVVVNSFE